MKLHQAQDVARRLVKEIEPYCEHVCVAGSIRRQVPEVKDVEVVAIPKWGEKTKLGDLFGDTEPANLLYEYFQNQPIDHIKVEWIKPGATRVEPWHIRPDGKYWRGLIGVANGSGPMALVKLDLFLARAENFGVIYTIRTGSADFSRELVTYARDKTPYRVQGGELMFSGPVLCPDEETLFAALQLRWIEPERRRGASDIIPI